MIKANLKNTVRKFEQNYRELSDKIYNATNPKGTHLEDYNEEYLENLRRDLEKEMKGAKVKFSLDLGNIRMSRKAVYEAKNKPVEVKTMTDRELEEIKVKSLLLQEDLGMLNKDNIDQLIPELEQKYKEDRKALTLLKNRATEIDTEKGMLISIPNQQSDIVDLELANYLHHLDKHLDLAVSGLHTDYLGLEGLLDKVDDNLMLKED